MSVRYRMRRCPEGWLAIVLIGERRIASGPFPSRKEARRVARKHCAELANAKEF